MLMIRMLVPGVLGSTCRAEAYTPAALIVGD